MGDNEGSVPAHALRRHQGTRGGAGPTDGGLSRWSHRAAGNYLPTVPGSYLDIGRRHDITSIRLEARFGPGSLYGSDPGVALELDDRQFP
jgi:hypothetical protein